MKRKTLAKSLLAAAVVLLGLAGAALAEPRDPASALEVLLAQAGLPPGAKVCEQVGGNIRFCRQGTTCCNVTKECCKAGERCTATGCAPIGTTCEVCYRHLHASVRRRAGGNPSFLRSYVQQAIKSYQNCKAKARGSCAQGDQLVDALRICDRFNQAGYVACTKQGVGLQP